MFEVNSVSIRELKSVYSLIKECLPDDPIVRILKESIFINIVLKSLMIKNEGILVTKNSKSEIIGIAIIGDFTNKLLYKSLFINVVKYPIDFVYSVLSLKRLAQLLYFWILFLIKSPKTTGVELCWICVKNEYRNLKVGTILLSEAEKSARDSGAEFLWLKTLVKTISSSNFYLSNNYDNVYQDRIRILYTKKLVN
jgi:ribosomal protein S18 acetylase RimI-like enzyme